MSLVRGLGPSSLCIFGACLLAASTAWADVPNDEGDGPSDDTPPFVEITSPADKATFTLPEKVTVAVEASDPESAVASAFITIDGQARPTLSEPPFEWPDLELSEGMHQIVASATSDGGTGTSTTINVAVFAEGTDAGSSESADTNAGNQEAGEGDSSTKGCSCSAASSAGTGWLGAGLFVTLFGLGWRRRPARGR